ncbi:MarR family winged helix-turn-helix transcriptional regulator [Rhodococcus qingshengii]|uniref:MarR family winged helix-turn-helix transcriptional regulator n=1 Tax=Rhodococcus qingshengii TaxID=334542 RepID=UPI0035E05557
MSTAEYDDLPQQWARAWPDLPTEGLPIVARVMTLALRIDQFHVTCLDGSGLTHPEYAALSILRMQERYELTPVELSKVLHQTTAGTSKTIDRLVRKSLVVRKPDPRSKRQTLVCLTASGIDTAEEAGRAEAEGRRLLMEQIADPDSVTKCLDVLLDALQGIQLPTIRDRNSDESPLLPTESA